MTDILDRIEAYKRTEIAEAKVRMPLATLQRNVRDHDPPRGFVHAIEQKLNQRRIALIAEIKKASPSRGSSARISIRRRSPRPMRRPGPPASPC